MTCYHPLSAWQTESGDIVFAEKGAIARSLELPCGQCIGCRYTRSQAWAIRCMHEAQLHDVNSFVTLTYDDEHYKPSLDYRDFQLFMKRLRIRGKRVRFFACGEYGEETQRPHFHACLFGRTFNNPKEIGDELFRSAELEKLWPFGMSSFGAVTYQSAGYVARYSVKKVSGPAANEHYKRVHLQTGEIVDVQPEFARMSLRPAVGRTWFDKFHADVYAARDGVVVQGKTIPAPRYYDDLLDKRDFNLAINKEYDRYINGLIHQEDRTPERLLDREVVQKAKLATLQRNKL